MKKVLIINANPKTHSFCRSLAEEYKSAIIGLHHIDEVHLSDLDFAVSLDQGYDEDMPLEPDLVELQRKILWADHLVIVCPVWWGGMPAKFKGLIDRILLPNFAFKYRKGNSVPDKLLKGRTAELIFTMDTPVFWYKYVNGNPIEKELKHLILGFVGIKTHHVMYFGPMISASEQQRRSWLDSVAKRAKNL